MLKISCKTVMLFEPIFLTLYTLKPPWTNSSGKLREMLTKGKGVQNLWKIEHVIYGGPPKRTGDYVSRYRRAGMNYFTAVKGGRKACSTWDKRKDGRTDAPIKQRRRCVRRFRFQPLRRIAEEVTAGGTAQLRGCPSSHEGRFLHDVH